MARFVAEADDFVFDRWAITCPYAFHDTREHRRAVEIVTDDFMAFRACIRQPAGQLILQIVFIFGKEAEMVRLSVTGLFLGFGIIDARSHHPRRRAGLEARQFKSQIKQIFGQLDGWLRIVRSG